MAENKDKLFELESELFALVNSTTNLYEKYKKGLINDNFFRKAIKNAMKGLMRINMYYNEKHIQISQILMKMNITEEYKAAMKLFKKISDSGSDEKDFYNDYSANEDKKTSQTILELPGITSEITSSFITLMDALKLEGLKSSELVTKLFKDLIKSIEKFQGFKDIYQIVEKIYTQVLRNPTHIIENKKFREIIVEKLYQAFKEFQAKLNLSF